MATLVPTRMSFDFVSQHRVGVNSTTYSYVKQATGIGPLEWEETNPWVSLPIPGGANSVDQLILNPNCVGWCDFASYEAITYLYYETNVDGSSNKAVTATSRNVIGYYAFVVKATTITEATDARTVGTTTFSFTNAKVLQILKRFDQPATPWRVHFKADSVTQTDA